MTEQEQAKQAQNLVKALYEDGVATINGRDYYFLKMTHVNRRKVFAFYSSVQHQLRSENMAFLDTPQYAAVEQVMWDSVTFEGATISKLRDHWEEYPEDYLKLVSSTMAVMSYPFMRAAGIASASQGDTNQPTTLEKQM